MNGDALALARHWLERERPERALEELQAVTGDAAVTRAAYLIRAHCLYRLDRDADAAAAARSAIANHGPDPDLLDVLGCALTALNDLEQAERAFLDGLALEPTHVGLLCGYARLCAFVAQFGKAEALVARAASHEPEAAEVARTRVLLATAKGDDTAADRMSRKGLAHDPDDVAARTLHGMAAAERGDVSAAYGSYRHAVASSPGDQNLLDAARELRVANHPLLWPLRPMVRFGPFKTWIAAVALIVAANAAELSTVAAVIAIVWVAYAVYSWVAPPLVGRWVRRGR